MRRLLRESTSRTASVRRSSDRCWKAQDLCAQEEPLLVDRGQGHPVACHFPEIVAGLALDVEEAHAAVEGIDLADLSAPEPIIAADQSPEPVIVEEEPDPVETTANG